MVWPDNEVGAGVVVVNGGAVDNVSGAVERLRQLVHGRDAVGDKLVEAVVLEDDAAAEVFHHPHPAVVTGSRGVRLRHPRTPRHRRVPSEHRLADLVQSTACMDSFLGEIKLTSKGSFTPNALRCDAVRRARHRNTARPVWTLLAYSICLISAMPRQRNTTHAVIYVNDP